MNLMDFCSKVNLQKKKKKRLLSLVDLKNKLKSWHDLCQGQTRVIGPASLSRRHLLVKVLASGTYKQAL